MPGKTTFVSVTTTLDAEPPARALARRIVDERLAACVQAMPIHSTYRWKGKVEAATEIRLVCKTRASRVGALMAFIRKHHSYEVPEITVTPILQGLPAYMNWIREETRPRP
jgi:periplasmic divalent cation tolerance protein